MGWDGMDGKVFSLFVLVFFLGYNKENNKYGGWRYSFIPTCTYFYRAENNNKLPPKLRYPRQTDCDS